jgi:hypothetical protein
MSTGISHLITAYSGRRRAMTPGIKARPTVWVISKFNFHGKYHEVLWARDGDIDAADRRGDIRRFRLWAKAIAFGKKKKTELGAVLYISS